MNLICVCSLQDGVDREYYAVFDGHGGVDAATYAATHLHIVLSQQEALKSDAATAFKSTFTQTDDMFKIKAKREVRTATRRLRPLEKMHAFLNFISILLSLEIISITV